MRNKVFLLYIVLQIMAILQVYPVAGVDTGFEDSGVFFKGMMKDELFEAYKGRYQLLCFQKIIDKERIILRDTSLRSIDNIITFELKNGRVTKWDTGYNPDGPGNSKDTSNKIKLTDWHKLRRNQQISFLLKYLVEINKKFGTHITIDVDRYILAMDHYANLCNINSMAIPAAEAINTILIGEGKAREQKT